MICIGAAAALGVLLYRGAAEAQAGRGGATEAPRRALAAALGLAAAVGAAVGVLQFVAPHLAALALLMIRVDLFAFGGGFASVPLMLHETVDVRQWMDSKTFMDGIALGQVTPGPIVITATFVGYQVAGPAGAVVATAGVFAPSLALVLATVPYLDRLRRSALFRRALRGILASFVGLLAAVAVNFGRAVEWTVPAGLLAAAAFAALRLKVDILWVVLAGAAVAVLVL
jgi:chromate transporter